MEGGVQEAQTENEPREDRSDVGWTPERGVEHQVAGVRFRCRPVANGGQNRLWATSIFDYRDTVARMATRNIYGAAIF